METLFIGKNLIFLPEVHSTNSYATDLLKNVNLPEGTVIHAAHQTQGKGQRGAAWNAEASLNLTASVLLKPGFLSIQNQFYLYQIAALACYDAMTELLKESQFDIKIKWPNDILINKKKIAGILIENTILHDQLNWSVIGIGINVNQVLFEQGIHATSLKLLLKRTLEIETVLNALCRHLEKHYLSLFKSQYVMIQKQYLSHLYGLNQVLDFEHRGGVEKLLVKGLGSGGLLLLEDSAGQHREVDVKEIKWLFQP